MPVAQRGHRGNVIEADTWYKEQIAAARRRDLAEKAARYEKAPEAAETTTARGAKGPK